MNNNNYLCALSTVCVTKNILINLLEESSSDSSTDEDFALSFLTSSGNFDKQKVTRIVSYVERTVPGYTVQQFQQHFRLSRLAYEALENRQYTCKKRDIGRQTISVEKQILSVLWLIATPDSFRSVADRFDMGKSSLSVSFCRVIKTLNQISHDIISWPTGYQVQYVRESFKSIAGLDNIIGAIDGTSVPIKAPQIDREVYITRKCIYAIVLQAVCDSDLKFTDVFVGYPGSVSDARVFSNSDLYKKVQNNLNFFDNENCIIGDKAYPVLTWCIPPYIDRGTLTRVQKHFNKVHARTRQVIERSFALLFGRFRRLKYLDMNRYDLIPATVLAATVLHNICLNHNELNRQQYIQDGMEMIQQNEEILHVHDNVFNINQAKIKRDNMARNLFYN